MLGSQCNGLRIARCEIHQVKHQRSVLILGVFSKSADGPFGWRRIMQEKARLSKVELSIVESNGSCSVRRWTVWEYKLLLVELTTSK